MLIYVISQQQQCGRGSDRAHFEKLYIYKIYI